MQHAISSDFFGSFLGTITTIAATMAAPGLASASTPRPRRGGGFWSAGRGPDFEGGDGFDGDSWRRGRKFSAEDLQLLLLSLLEESRRTAMN